MKFKNTGYREYTAENGCKIKKIVSINIFTSREMPSCTRWHIYNPAGEDIGWELTLREAKAFIEREA